MTAAVLVMVLCAAVAHAIWNIAAKSVNGKGYAFVWAYHGLSAVLLAPIGIWLLVSGAVPFNGGLLIAALLSAVFHIAYSVTLQAGYDRAPLGIVYPTARGTGPIITILIAILVLGERPHLIEVVGALIVIAGIALVTINPRLVRAGRSETNDPAGPNDPADASANEGSLSAKGRRKRSRAGVLQGLFWGGLTGVFIASYTLWDNYSVNQLTDSPLLYFAVSEFCVLIIMSLGGFVVPGGAKRRKDFAEILRDHKKPLITVAVLSPVAYVLVLFAMQSAPVSLVAPVRETSIIVGMLLAWWFFGEKNIASKLVGAVIVVIGIGLIALV